MVMSHLGRPKEGKSDAEELARAGRGEARRAARPQGAARDDWLDGVDVAPGEVVLLENCRFNEGRRRRTTTALAQTMAALCDVYVNDAFGTAHRAEATHARRRALRASRVRGPAAGRGARRARGGAREAEAAAGRDRRRLEGLDQARRAAALGGEGRPADRRRRHREHLPRSPPAIRIGKSLVEPDLVDVREEDARRLVRRRRRCRCPTDVVVAKEASSRARAARSSACSEVAADDMILDIGPETAAALCRASRESAGTIVWNGPVGVFEFDRVRATARSASPRRSPRARRSRSPAAATRSPRSSKYGVGDRISYISTGGGAFLEFLEGKTLARRCDAGGTRASAETLKPSRLA